VLLSKQQARLGEVSSQAIFRQTMTCSCKQ